MYLVLEYSNKTIHDLTKKSRIQIEVCLTKLYNDAYFWIYLKIAALLGFSTFAVCGGGAGFLFIPVLKTYLPAAQVPAALSIGTASS